MPSRTCGDITEKEWEALCKRCGECCFEKWIEGDGSIHPTSIPCRFLDIVTRECGVYHKRFDVGEGCVKLSPEVVSMVEWLPEDCAYVKRIRNTGE
jgi:uncharacterized cysteine cluster protein YcgN (CxxCxxCC family)